MALLGPAFANEIRVVRPPWPVPRVAFALLAPIARLRGRTAADGQQRPDAAGST